MDAIPPQLDQWANDMADRIDALLDRFALDPAHKEIDTHAAPTVITEVRAA